MRDASGCVFPAKKSCLRGSLLKFGKLLAALHSICLDQLCLDCIMCCLAPSFEGAGGQKCRESSRKCQRFSRPSLVAMICWVSFGGLGLRSSALTTASIAPQTGPAPPNEAVAAAARASNGAIYNLPVPRCVSLSSFGPRILEGGGDAFSRNEQECTPGSTFTVDIIRSCCVKIMRIFYFG